MKQRDRRISAFIFALVVVAHVALVAGVLLGPSGCQQSLASGFAKMGSGLPTEAPSETAAEPVRLNLTLADGLAHPSPTEERTTGEDPASRLTFPSDGLEVPEQRDPQPLVQEETEAALEKEAARRAEEERIQAEEERIRAEALAKAEHERVAREKEEAAKLRRDEERRAREQAEAELAAAEKRKRKAEEAAAEKRRREQALAEAKQKEAERKQAEARRKAEAEAKRKAAAEAEALAAQKRREEEARKRRVAAAQAQAEEAEAEEAKRRETAEAVVRRVERAKVVSASPGVSQAVVKPNVLGNGGAAEGVARGGSEGGKPAAPDMGAYRASVQKMIRGRWSIPRGLAVKNHPEILVRIDRSGKVVYTRMNRGSGIPAIDKSAIASVRIGSRLIPLPAGYDKDLYEVTVKFQID